jgi:hypothetical protein
MEIVSSYAENNVLNVFPRAAFYSGVAKFEIKSFYQFKGISQK